MDYTRKDIARIIVENITSKKEEFQRQYKESKDKIGYFFIDNLLPEDLAITIYKNFPSLEETVIRKNIREFKYTAYQMNKYYPLLEEVIYAFQDKEVIMLVEEICEVKNIYADEFLYAGGLSLMKKNNFLTPHLDNSHDKDRNQWRVFNLLYYITPNWQLENGGNLELYPHGLNKKPITIVSKFNRLAVMATHKSSWHSVSKVKVNSIRCCVSNYYFSDKPLLNTDTFHVTTFRGKSSEKIKDYILQIDNSLRSCLRRLFKKGVRENPHQYKK